MLKKRFYAFVFSAIIPALSIAAGPAHCGSVGKSMEQIEAQLGIRAEKNSKLQLQPGSTMTAKVLNPDRLTKFGLNAKQGEAVILKQVDKEGRFIIVVGGKSKGFIMGSKGSISPSEIRGSQTSIK